LDVADLLSDTRQKELNNRLAGIMNVIEQINTTMAEQSQLLQQVAGVIGVIVPAWRNLREVEEGSDEPGGVDRPSAAELGLQIEIIALQLEPGFGHEDVVSSDPASGTLVPRGYPDTRARKLPWLILCKGSAIK
jgi:hypothetical protein